MQLFGIISVLVTVSLFFWWFSISVDTQGSDGSVRSDRSQYVEALESAESAAGQLGD